MLLARVANYEIFRPKLDTTRERLHGIATLEDDISPAFPTINAELGGWDYDQKNQVLLLTLSNGKWIPLLAREIAIKLIFFKMLDCQAPNLSYFIWPNKPHK